MPRAFLIKKNPAARYPTDRPPKKLWTSSWIDSESMGDDEDSGLPSSQPALAENAPLDGKGPYDLSVKAKTSTEVLSFDSSKAGATTEKTLTRVGIVAPKPIKPEPKSAEEIVAAKTSSWQQQIYAPYLALNHPSYVYATSPDVYSMSAASHFVPHQAIVPPPLVPLPATGAADRYSPPAERYATYDVPSRCTGGGGTSPLSTQSPSPPGLYSGWISDGQDSGLASSPSPSSEDGEQNTRQSSQVRYQCPDCSKNYSTYSGLSKHRLMHCTTQVKKSFSCKHCDKVYVSLGALKMHIRTHTLPCKCKLCGKAFSRPWLLQGHIRTHTGEKPFSCPLCSRAFADRSNLRAHLQTHSEVKKYRCKTCSKTFSRMSLLLKHEDGGCSGDSAAAAR